MLTATSNIIAISGYQDQQNVFSMVTSNSASKNDPPRNQNDEVSVSQEARELQQVYKKKETVLEQNYTAETRRLESEFLQEKNRLKTEHTQKKQALEINVYV